MYINNVCPMCGKAHTMNVDDESYFRYIDGALIQDAFPEYNPMEREFVKSGYCPQCQSLLFGAEYETDRIEESERW